MMTDLRRCDDCAALCNADDLSRRERAAERGGVRAVPVSLARVAVGARPRLARPVAGTRRPRGPPIRRLSPICSELGLDFPHNRNANSVCLK